MSELPPVRFRWHETADVVTARRAARELCEQLGFRKADQTRLATAVLELTRNVIQYANHGECVIENRLLPRTADLGTGARSGRGHRQLGAGVDRWRQHQRRFGRRIAGDAALGRSIPH